MRIVTPVATACTALVVFAAIAAAQDPAKVASSHYKVLAENERVRVLRVTMPAGAKAAMHDHPAHVAVALTEARVQMTTKDGKTSEVPLALESAMLAPAGPHATANGGNAAFEAILVELKGAPGTGTLPTSRPGLKMTPLLQDARVTAYRVSFSPSFHEPPGTTHDYDQIVIPLGPGDTALTLDGKTRSSWQRGEIQLIGRGTAHETKMGTAAADMIIVAVK
jgi:quercetin dioxygenase-like cupin family protein